MSVVSMKQLLEAGVHFGHQTFKWNPKMKNYIFIKRNGIHIIDLKQTVDAINEAYQFLKEIANRQEYILFVGTKKQAQAAIRAAGEKSGVFYVNQRWYGGMLTNMATIRQSIEKMKYYEEIVADGTINNYTKLEQQKMKRMHDKIEFSLGGIRDMDAVPGAIFVVDTGHEEIAVHEARILGVPIVAMVDTNCDPDLVDYVIPSNDDATRAIQLITDIMATAVLEGKNIATEGADVKAEIEEEPEEFTPDLVDMAAAPVKDIEPEEVEIEEVIEDEAEVEEAVAEPEPVKEAAEVAEPVKEEAVAEPEPVEETAEVEEPKEETAAEEKVTEEETSDPEK